MAAAVFRGKRVMITGAGGFIGARLAQYFDEKHARVYAMLSPRGSARRLKTSPRMKIVRGDILNAPRLQALCRKIKPHYIFHLAAHGNQSEHYAGVLRKTQERRMSRINIDGMANLLAASESVPYEYLVYTGSAFAEYGKGKKKFRESQVCRPATLYGVTKAAGSALAQAYGRTAGRNVIALRLSYVYGPGEGLDRLIPAVVRSAMTGQTLPLTSLNEKKDFIYIDDVLDAFARVVRSRLRGCHVFNVGSSRESKLRDVLKTVKKITGRRVAYREGAYKSVRWAGQCWAVDIRKARKVLGWKPKHTLYQGVKKTISWMCVSRKSSLDARH